jgi:hypothetical protein
MNLHSLTVRTRGSAAQLVQAERSRVPFPMRSLDFSNDLVALVSTPPLTSMSIRNLPGGKRRPTHKTDLSQNETQEPLQP